MKKSLPTFIAITIVVGVFAVGAVEVRQGAVSVSAVPAAEATWNIQTCDVTANTYAVQSGANVTISWTTQGFAQFTLNGATVSGPNGSQTFTNIQANTTYTLEATTADGKSNCVTSVTVTCIPVPPPTCTLTPETVTIENGESVSLTWSTTNAASASLTDFGTVGLSGSQNTGALTANKNYTLAVTGTDGSHINCHSTITVKPVVVPSPTCTLTPVARTIASGDSVTLEWTTTNAASASLTDFGTVGLSGSQSTGALTANKTYTLNVVGTDGSSVSCPSVITVTQNPPKVCELTLTKSVNKTTAVPGDELTYTISIKNTGTKDCTGGGVKIVDIHDTNLSFISETHSANLTAGYGSAPLYDAASRTLRWNGSTLTPGEEGTITWVGKVNPSLTCGVTTKISNQAKATAYELNNFTTWAYSNTVETTVLKECPNPEPVCESFTASPATLTKGSPSTLNWVTRNASRVVINNGIGEVAATGTLSISPLATTEYLLTAYGVGTSSVTCKTTITVTEIPVPVCTAFTATPASLPVGGGNTTLTWTSVNATSATISPTVGSVAANGSTTVALSTTTTFTLTVAGENNQTNACTVTVPVEPPVAKPFTCENNVSFSANPVRISRGDTSTLTWSTTGVTAVRFDQGIAATSLSGSTTVSPSNDTTYTLTATQGTSTIACPVSVTVTSGGGGGGGSSSPTCELTLSKKSINAGDEITLRYDSSRTTDLKLVDSFGKTLVTTYNKRSSEKSDLMDGSLKLTPKSDTTYTLTVERGSKERTCKVSVDVKNNIVVTQIRDQQPLVSGITLDQVPYTGFEAGPVLTLSFYLLLMAWALYVAYLIAIKRDIIGGYRLAGARPVDTADAVAPELIRPDVFVAAVRAPEVPPSATLPANLPVGTPVVGYAAATGTATVSTDSESADEAVTTLENYAHAKKALLSSDAIRHLMGTTTHTDEQVAILNEVITEAKAKYPSEDGWVVINEKRMRELCLVCQAKPVPSSVAPFVPAVIPEGSGSLAEAIVTGNIVAAYEMIGHRPMFALADASADLDAIYRARKTGAKVGSDLLQTETAKLTDEQVLAMIKALTSALDGVYTDEASAVKMAIMKAVKVVA